MPTGTWTTDSSGISWKKTYSKDSKTPILQDIEVSEVGDGVVKGVKGKIPLPH